MLKLLICMGGNSIYKELLEQSGYDTQTATTSAFVQQRSKMLPEVFELILREFTTHQAMHKKHKGYRLLAVDGSSLNLPTNPNEPETYFQREGAKNYNLMHLNALYDIKNNLYLDISCQLLIQSSINSPVCILIFQPSIDGLLVVSAN